MIKAFPKSRRIAIWVGIPLAIVSLIISWFILGNFVSGIFSHVLVSAIIAVIAYSLVLMVCRVIAAGEYQKLLLPLYENLDPEAMLSSLGSINENCLSDGERIMFLVHKANGYIYLGEFSKAEEILSSVSISEKDLSNKYLITGGLATCRLLSGNAKGVRECIDSLMGITKVPNCSKDLSLRARRVVGYIQFCQSILMGRNADIEAAIKDFETSRVPVHKLDVAYYIAIYMSRHKDERAAEYISYVKEKGSKTVYPKLLNL